MSTPENWHFGAETVQFLGDLQANNSREWFLDNKAVYEELYKKPADFFCHIMAERLSEELGVPFTPKVFRIYRDVRFSKDKTPYNTHLHISFSPAGKKMPAYFFGLQPENLTLGAGTFGFQGKTLDAYRAQVLGEAGKKLKAIIRQLTDDGFRLSEPALKRTPRGFPDDHANSDLLRYKGFAAWFDFPTTSKATSGDLVATCLDRFLALSPLVDWLLELEN